MVPMPLKLESIGDESNIEDFENRRFYVQMFEMKLLGYILDEDDYEVVPTINRTMLTIVKETRIVSDIVFDTDKRVTLRLIVLSLNQNQILNFHLPHNMI
jgi:hypothetical protein